MSTQSSQSPELFFQDSVIGDTTIPAGVSVMYNTFSLHMDKQHWIDPEIFRQSMSNLTLVIAINTFLRPERFLDEEGHLKPNEMLQPFGIGRHKCLGESLAKMENFLFFANIFKTFKFSQVGDTPPSLDPDVGFTNGPYPFKTKITISL